MYLYMYIYIYIYIYRYIHIIYIYIYIDVYIDILMNIPWAPLRKGSKHVWLFWPPEGPGEDTGALLGL